MNNILVPLFIFGFLSSSCNHHVHKKNFVLDKQSDIGQAIEQHIAQVDPNINIGIKIIDLAKGRVVFEKNADRHFVPSSTIKLLTLASALHYLGPSFRFKTSIYAEGYDANKHSAHNIIIKGSGDPSLSDHDLIAIVLELKQLGLKTITGDIIVDDSIFDNVPWSDSMMVADRAKGFGAPISGLNLNYNRYIIKMRPAAKAGDMALVVSSPSIAGITLVNNIVTVDKNKRGFLNIEINKQLTSWPEADQLGLTFGDTITLKGGVRLANGASYRSFSIKDPSIFAGHYFKEQLHHAGITTKGSVKRGLLPEKGTVLIEHHSRSLAEAATDWTKISNNVANDVLIKTLAARQALKPATLQDGLKIMADFLLNEVKVKDRRFVFGDGSGLSRYNLITPSQLITLLEYSAKNFSLGPEFITALPIAGTDGLLSGRMRTNTLRKNIRAKTGSMTGLNSLAGYFVSEDGRRFAFAIMINGFVGPAKQYADLQDKILSLMYSTTHEELAKKR